MKWIRAIDKVPDNGEETLIRTRGIFQLAFYHEIERVFITRNGDRFRINADLHWSGLETKELAPTH